LKKLTTLPTTLPTNDSTESKKAPTGVPFTLETTVLNTSKKKLRKVCTNKAATITNNKKFIIIYLRTWKLSLPNIYHFIQRFWSPALTYPQDLDPKG